mmetsp:Transcript_23078/g.46710  ORF Transcript_23078/g.46710 Transcript_23078/m.46710 type:complete len:539 (-) Transcript_23078:7-1623(-)
MVRFIPGTMVIEPFSDSEHEEELDEVEHHSIAASDACDGLLDRNDGWSHCFNCIDEDANPVRDIIHEAVHIHFTQNERIESTFTLDAWRRMGETLSRCQKLKQFVMDDVRLTPEILTALFRSEGGSYGFPLEILSLMWGEFGSEGMRILHPFLMERTVPMKSLCLFGAHMDEEGAKLLAEVLERFPIKNLDVRVNPLGVGGISKMLSAKHAKSLSVLQLGQNSFDRIEIAQVAKFLKRNDAILQYLSIGESDFNMECVKTLLHSLENNSNLGELVFSPWTSWFDEFGIECVDSMTFDRLSEAIISLTCDTFNMQALFKSNHSLWRLNTISPGVLSPAAQTLLMINGMDISTNEKIRYKLRSIYFQGSFRLQPFLSMNITYMPHVLELVTRRDDDPEEQIHDKWGNLGSRKAEGDLNGVYRFVRDWNLPHLFHFASENSRGDRAREKKLFSGSNSNRMDIFSHFQLDCLLSEINCLPGLDGKSSSELDAEKLTLPLKLGVNQSVQSKGLASPEDASEGLWSRTNNYINLGSTYNMDPWG